MPWTRTSTWAPVLRSCHSTRPSRERTQEQLLKPPGRTLDQLRPPASGARSVLIGFPPRRSKRISEGGLSGTPWLETTTERFREAASLPASAPLSPCPITSARAVASLPASPPVSPVAASASIVLSSVPETLPASPAL